MLSNKSIAILLIVSITFLSILSLKLVTPSEVVASDQGDTQFSAERALIFLSTIAAEPHLSGTPAHAKVRDYIFTYCQRMGLETQLMAETGMNVYSNSVRAGHTQNIFARLKGTQPGKAILVMSHYDSQPNTPAASDDGAGVAAMMEAIRLLKTLPPLKNDVIFLFTDLEESGLFGAEAFVSHYKNLNEIGLIMNFEARGNSGVSFTFEFSKENGWMMHEYAKAISRPFANSFAYEIYKVMPNDTDFSKFRNTGITGFNSGFIDGYSYYHSMADRIENMDVRSLQQHGDILMESLQHFGNISLENTKGEDAIFFNPIGSVLWLYPLSWDLPLMIATCLLWLALIIIGIKKKRIKISSLLIGAGLFVAFLFLSGLLVWGFTKLVVIIYPYYTNFYSYNFYNATDYFIAIAGLVLLSYVLVFKKAACNKSHESIMVGVVFVMLLLMIGIKLKLNTGAYLIYYPSIVLMVVYLIYLIRNISHENQAATYSLSQLLFIAPAILLWLPMAKTIFIAFSLILPFGAVLLLAFGAPFLLNIFFYSKGWGKNFVYIFPTMLIVIGTFKAHIHSGYDQRHPLQSELMYAVDSDHHDAYWVSGQIKLDEWNGKYFSSPAKQSLDEFYSGSGNSFWKSNAPFKEYSKGKIEVMNDSISEGKRFLRIKAIPDSASHGIRLFFFDTATLISLNERTFGENTHVQFLQFMAPPPGGIILELKTENEKPMKLRVIEQRMGLPESLLGAPMPQNFIYAPNYFSNSTHLKYEIDI